MKIKVGLYLFLMAAVLVWAACRKTDSKPGTDEQASSVKESRFFGEHRSSNPQIEAISQWVKQQNDKKNFVGQTVKQIGYPRWDKAFLQTTGSGLSHRGGTDSSFTVFFVPFVRDSQNYVNASLLIKATPTDTTMGYICDWQYQDFGFNHLSDTALRAKNIFHLFALFDNNTFGHTSFKLRDQRLYSHEDSLAIASNNIPFDSAQVIYTLVNTGVSGRGSGTGSYTITTCSDFAECISWGTSGFRNQFSSGRSGSLPGCVVSVSWTICTSTLILEPGDLPTGGTSTPPTGTGGSGGGTGGGGSSTPPECGGPTTGSKTESNYNCGPGWAPVPVPDNPPINSPCDKVNQLKNNSWFRQAFNVLKDSTASLREHGYYVTYDSTAFSVYGNKIGAEGITWMISTPIWALMHSHFAGGLPIFSAGDFEQIAILKEGQKIDPSSFVGGLATETGSYAFTIDDPLKFEEFVEHYLGEDGLGRNEIELIYNRYGIGSYTSTSANIKAFLQMMDNLDMGISLLKANNDYTTFSKLTLSGNSILETPCN